MAPFRKQVDVVVKTVFNNVQPKMVEGAFVAGHMLCSILRMMESPFTFIRATWKKLNDHV